MTIQKHNDEYGWKRGQGAYSKEDKAFTSPKHKYGLPLGVDSKYGAIMKSGDRPTGPVSKGGPPRFKPKHGPISNAQRPK